MNKFVLLGLIVLFVTMMTFVLQSAEANYLALEQPEQFDPDSLTGMLGFVRTFLRLMTFRLEVLPNIFGVPLSITIWFMIGYMAFDAVWIG